MKKLLLAGFLFTVASLHADVYLGGTSSSGTFRGEITAVESDRNSITVQSAENTVKMFHVSSAQARRLQVGQKVTVSYVDGYTWPLKTRSIR